MLCMLNLTLRELNDSSNTTIMEARGYIQNLRRSKPETPKNFSKISLIVLREFQEADRPTLDRALAYIEQLQNNRSKILKSIFLAKDGKALRDISWRHDFSRFSPKFLTERYHVEDLAFLQEAFAIPAFKKREYKDTALHSLSSGMFIELFSTTENYQAIKKAFPHDTTLFVEQLKKENIRKLCDLIDRCEPELFEFFISAHKLPINEQNFITASVVNNGELLTYLNQTYPQFLTRTDVFDACTRYAKNEQSAEALLALSMIRAIDFKALFSDIDLGDWPKDYYESMSDTFFKLFIGYRTFDNKDIHDLIKVHGALYKKNPEQVMDRMEQFCLELVPEKLTLMIKLAEDYREPAWGKLVSRMAHNSLLEKTLEDKGDMRHKTKL